MWYVRAAADHSFAYVFRITCFQHVHISLSLSLFLKLGNWLPSWFITFLLKETCWGQVSWLFSVRMSNSDHGLGKLREKLFNALPQPNTTEAFVRIILFILMKYRELFLLLSHILLVTKLGTWGELISLWIASTCDHSKTTRVLWIWILNILQIFFKYRKAVWLFDLWTSWHVYLWNPLKFLSRHCLLSFQT